MQSFAIRVSKSFEKIAKLQKWVAKFLVATFFSKKIGIFCETKKSFEMLQPEMLDEILWDCEVRILECRFEFV